MDLRRHNFYIAVQQTGKSHLQWAARLCGLAAHCNFKNLEDSLLDKFVMGIVPGHERDKLFAQDIAELTLSKAVDMAESVRCARAGAAAGSVPGHAAPSHDAVFNIKRSNEAQESRDSSLKCSVCGYKGHQPAKCRFSGYKCRKCYRKGHLHRMCPDKKVNYVEQGNSDDEGETMVSYC